MNFTEETLENAIIQLLGEQSYQHVHRLSLVRELQEVLIREDLHTFLARRERSQRQQQFLLNTMPLGHSQWDY